MPSYSIDLSDKHATMLQWASEVRRMPIEEIVKDSLSEFLRPLEAKYMLAHKAELAELFEQLTIAQQVSVMDQIKELLKRP